MALALYRKYRPRTFAEVIGQEHVTEPLSQALRSGRLNHAYLFSGPRGCGKTSSARILARSLNCEQGPTPEPCGQCMSCRSLANDGAGSIDVIEIDAASHGGVDDARELREKAFFAPANSRYKIYVIDEAHMVSSAGFNALLKLVEEPPEYVKFIFATTEPEKVLGTIKSRTHHYPFRLIPPSVLRPYLEQLCEAEGVTVEPAVFPLVVRAGGGSARDTLSVLDQLIAGAGEEGVTYARAVALLGVTDSALIDDMIESLAASDGAAAYSAIDRVAEAGHDPRRFATDLLERFRDLIVMQQVPDAAAKGLIDGPADEIERMTAQSGRFGAATLSRAADIVHNGLVEMRGTTGPRLLLELITARMLLPGADDSTNALLQRLERMERALQDPSGVRLQPAPGAAAPAPVAPAGPVAPAAPVAAAPANDAGFDARAAARQAAARSSGGGATGARQAATQASPAAQGRRPAVPGTGQADAAPSLAPESSADPQHAVSAGAPQAPAPQPEPAPGPAPQAAPTAAPQPQVGPPHAGPSQAGASQAGPASTGPAPASAPQAGPAPAAASPAAVPVEAPTSGGPAASDGPDVTELRGRWWPEAHAFVNTRSKRAGAMLRHATVRAVEGDTLVLTFQHPKHIDLFAGTPEEALLREAFYELFGVRWQIRCEPAGAAGAVDAPTSRPGGRAPAQRQSAGHPTPPTAPTRSLSETDPRSGPSPGEPSASPTAAEDAGRLTPAAVPSTDSSAQPDAEEHRPTPVHPGNAPDPTSGSDWPTPARPGDTAVVHTGPGTTGTPGNDWPAPARPGGDTASGNAGPGTTGTPGNDWPAPARPGDGTAAGNATSQGHPAAAAAAPHAGQGPTDDAVLPSNGGTASLGGDPPQHAQQPSGPPESSGGGRLGAVDSTPPDGRSSDTAGSGSGRVEKVPAADADDWPTPVRPGTAAPDSGRPSPAQPGSGHLPHDDGGDWPTPARPGGTVAADTPNSSDSGTGGTGDDWPTPTRPGGTTPADTPNASDSATGGTGNDWPTPARLGGAAGSPVAPADGGSGRASTGRSGDTPGAEEGGWPEPVQPGSGHSGDSSSRPSQANEGNASPAAGSDRPGSGRSGGGSGSVDSGGWPEPVQPGSGPGTPDNDGWPEPVPPGSGPGGPDSNGWPEPVRPGGASSASGHDGWPGPAQAGAEDATAVAGPVSPAPVAPAAESPRRAGAGGLAAARAAAAVAGGKQIAPGGGGQRGPVETRPAEVPTALPMATGGGSAWDDFPDDEEPPYDPDYDGPLPKGGGPVAVGGTSPAYAPPNRTGPAGVGASASGTAVPGTPVSGAPVSRAPVSGAPVSGAPVSGAPVSGAPVSGVPVPAAPMPGAAASVASVSAAPVPTASPAGQSALAKNPALASAKAAASRAAANAVAAAQGRSAQARAAAPAVEQNRPTQSRAAAAVAAANAAAAAAAAAQANQPAEAAAKEFEGFDPGDEPLDEVVDEQAARQSSEQQAFLLLQQAFGAEKIGEM